ncbi:medium-chain fatty-acid--CoA ligase [Pseudonocardia ailaonensis]|uniref:Medium-chain fatty-acid--CoA ligase n=1 Tax=Pseudonocardia ailaonensis TaxID=367279 RepID=A0ABN2N569_9PSEU
MTEVAMAPTAAEIDRWVAEKVWRTDNLLHVLDAHASAHGDRLAVADQHRRLSYREFADRTAALAAWLVGLGLPAGAVVAVQSPSNATIPLMHFACDRADLTFLPLSDAWREREIGHLLERSGARVVVVPPDRDDVRYSAMIAGLRADLPALEVVASFGPGASVDLDEVMLRPARHRGTGLATQSLPRMCMVTSGTSGFPKISLYSDDNLWFFLSVYRETLGVGEQPEVFAGIAPANTGSTGYLFPVLTPLLFGSSSVMLEHWNPVAALDLLAEEGASVAVAVPTQLIKMLDVAKRRGMRLPALRVLSNAGAPMPPDVAAEIDATLGQVLPMYGATDGGVPTMTTVDDPPGKRHRSVGRPLPHTELRIGEGAGSEVGEIHWRNPIKSYGYLNDAAQTAAAFTPEGLYRSGDLGRVDEDGYLHVVGRVKDLIIRGGQNISPREIEDVVVEMAEVLEVAALGVPDPVYGERVCLCVVPTGPLTLDRVAAHLRTRGLAEFMVPERFEVFDEFPTNSGGKVSKVDLRALVLARAAPNPEEAVR